MSGMDDKLSVKFGQAASGKVLPRGNSVVTVNQIYEHHNSIPARNRFLSTAKSLQQPSIDLLDPVCVSSNNDSIQQQQHHQSHLQVQSPARHYQANSSAATTTTTTTIGTLANDNATQSEDFTSSNSCTGQQKNNLANLTGASTGVSNIQQQRLYNSNNQTSGTYFHSAVPNQQRQTTGLDISSNGNNITDNNNNNNNNPNVQETYQSSSTHSVTSSSPLAASVTVINVARRHRRKQTSSSLLSRGLCPSANDRQMTRQQQHQRAKSPGGVRSESESSSGCSSPPASSPKMMARSSTSPKRQQQQQPSNTIPTSSSSSSSPINSSTVNINNNNTVSGTSFGSNSSPAHRSGSHLLASRAETISVGLDQSIKQQQEGTMTKYQMSSSSQAQSIGSSTTTTPETVTVASGVGSSSICCSASGSSPPRRRMLPSIGSQQISVSGAQPNMSYASTPSSSLKCLDHQLHLNQKQQMTTATATTTEPSELTTGQPSKYQQQQQQPPAPQPQHQQQQRQQHQLDQAFNQHQHQSQSQAHAHSQRRSPRRLPQIPVQQQRSFFALDHQQHHHHHSSIASTPSSLVTSSSSSMCIGQQGTRPKPNSLDEILSLKSSSPARATNLQSTQPTSFKSSEILMSSSSALHQKHQTSNAHYLTRDFGGASMASHHYSSSTWLTSVAGSNRKILDGSSGTAMTTSDSDDTKGSLGQTSLAPSGDVFSDRNVLKSTQYTSHSFDPSTSESKVNPNGLITDRRSSPILHQLTTTTTTTTAASMTTPISVTTTTTTTNSNMTAAPSTMTTTSKSIRAGLNIAARSLHSTCSSSSSHSSHSPASTGQIVTSSFGGGNSPLLSTTTTGNINSSNVPISSNTTTTTTTTTRAQFTFDLITQPLEVTQQDTASDLMNATSNSNSKQYFDPMCSLHQPDLVQATQQNSSMLLNSDGCHSALDITTMADNGSGQNSSISVSISTASSNRGRRLSSCGSGLRANFLMNKQRAISDFTPPKLSLESSSNSRGSTDMTISQQQQQLSSAGSALNIQHTTGQDEQQQHQLSTSATSGSSSIDTSNNQKVVDDTIRMKTFERHQWQHFVQKPNLDMNINQTASDISAAGYRARRASRIVGCYSAFGSQSIGLPPRAASATEPGYENGRISVNYNNNAPNELVETSSASTYGWSQYSGSTTTTWLQPSANSLIVVQSSSPRLTNIASSCNNNNNNNNSNSTSITSSSKTGAASNNTIKDNNNNYKSVCNYQATGLNANDSPEGSIPEANFNLHSSISGSQVKLHEQQQQQQQQHQHQDIHQPSQLQYSRFHSSGSTHQRLTPTFALTQNQLARSIDVYNRRDESSSSCLMNHERDFGSGFQTKLDNSINSSLRATDLDASGNTSKSHLEIPAALANRDRQPSNTSTVSMPTSNGSPQGRKFGLWAERIALAASNGASRRSGGSNSKQDDRKVRSASQLACRSFPKNSSDEDDNSSVDIADSMKGRGRGNGYSDRSSCCDASDESDNDGVALLGSSKYGKHRNNRRDQRRLDELMMKTRPKSCMDSMQTNQSKSHYDSRKDNSFDGLNCPASDDNVTMAQLSDQQLTLGDRLKLAEKSATELFRKVELSPKSQQSLNRPASAEGANRTNGFANKVQLPSRTDDRTEEPRSGYRVHRKQSIEYDNYDREGFKRAPSKQNIGCGHNEITTDDNNNNNDNSTINNNNDDEHYDDLSLFLSSVDRQRQAEVDNGMLPSNSTNSKTRTTTRANLSDGVENNGKGASAKFRKLVYRSQNLEVDKNPTELTTTTNTQNQASNTTKMSSRKMHVLRARSVLGLLVGLQQQSRQKSSENCVSLSSSQQTSGKKRSILPRSMAYRTSSSGDKGTKIFQSNNSTSSDNAMGPSLNGFEEPEEALPLTTERRRPNSGTYSKIFHRLSSTGGGSGVGGDSMSGSSNRKKSLVETSGDGSRNVKKSGEEARHLVRLKLNAIRWFRRAKSTGGSTAMGDTPTVTAETVASNASSMNTALISGNESEAGNFRNEKTSKAMSRAMATTITNNNTNITTTTTMLTGTTTKATNTTTNRNIQVAAAADENGQNVNQRISIFPNTSIGTEEVGKEAQRQSEYRSSSFGLMSSSSSRINDGSAGAKTSLLCDVVDKEKAYPESKRFSGMRSVITAVSKQLEPLTRRSAANG